MASWGKCDFKQLQDLQKRMNQLAESDIDVFCERVAKELAARLLRKVIKRTPVGEYESSSGAMGGTLRRGWTAETEGEAANGKQKNASQYANALPVKKAGGVYQITIINPVHYAPYVEFGHRTANHKGWVSGQFMLTISEKELREQAPKIIEKRVMQWLEGALNGK